MITFVIAFVYAVGFIIAWPKLTHHMIADAYQPDATERTSALLFGTALTAFWPLIAIAGAITWLIMRTNILRSDSEIREREKERAVAQHNEQQAIERLAADHNLPFVIVIKPRDPTSDRPTFTINGNDKYWICPGCHTTNYPGTGQLHRAECDYA